MKTLAIFVLVICSIQISQAQIIVNAYDNGGKLIGQPALEPNANRFMVVRPDNIAVMIDFTNGNVVSNSRNDIVFSETDCAGQAYNVTGPQPFSWISTYEGDAAPLPLFLFSKDSTSVPVSVQSRATTETPGCVNESGFNLAFPVTLISDPTQYGFVQTPSRGWGYAPPLNMKAVSVRSANDGVFCNSFEGCPAQ